MYISKETGDAMTILIIAGAIAIPIFVVSVLIGIGYLFYYAYLGFVG